MTRNAELNHEFNENKEQQKSTIFTYGDFNFQPGGAAPKLTDGTLLGELISSGKAHTGLKIRQCLLVSAIAVAVAIFIYWIIYLNGAYYPG